MPDQPPPKPASARDIQLDLASIDIGPVQQPTHIPILPIWLRVLFFAAALALLIGAFLLVFSVSLELLRHPVPRSFRGDQT